MGPETEVADARGASVLPGFIDPHNHVRLGSNPLEVQLAGARNARRRQGAHQGARGREPRALVDRGERGQLLGDAGRTHADLAGPRGAHDGRPAFLFTYDAHNAWLNREAMEAFGITRDTDALPWGTSGRTRLRRADGHRRGLRGQGHQPRRAGGPGAVVPGYARGLQYERTLETLDMAVAFGITTIVEPQNSPDDMWIFERARDEGRLRSRLVAAMFHPPARPTGSERSSRRAGRFDDDRLRSGPIKLYIDDVIEPWTAAMLEPYANRPG